MNRKRKGSVFRSEFAHLALALVMLGLIWLAYKSGLILWGTSSIMGLLKP